MHGLGTIKRINEEASRVAKAKRKRMDDHRAKVQADMERKKKALG